MLHIVIQIILEFVWSRREITLGEVVDIDEIVAAKEVCDLLVVLSPVDSGVQASCHNEIIKRTILECAGEIKILLVHMALFLNILRTVLAVCIRLDAVDMVETVPVDMGEFGIHIRMCPNFIRPTPLDAVVAVHIGILVIEITGEVTVVIWTWVLSVVPVKGRVTVLAETIECGGACIELVGRSEVVLDYRDRLIGLTHAGVADLAVLVSPVGVVHIISCQVVNFLCGSILRTALAGSGKEHESEFVGIVKHLVSRGVVCEGAIVYAIDPVVAAETCAHVECKGPAVIHQTGCIRAHKAQTVESTVGQHASAEALTDICRIAEYVGHSVISAKSEIRHFAAVRRLFGTHSFVKAAPEGERRITGDGVVHLYAGEIYILTL